MKFLKHTGLPALLLLLALMAGCTGTQTLQEYYVDNSENPDFLVLDVPASVVNLEEASLEPEQLRALKSLRKLNILAFRKTGENAEAYQAETAKVRQILENPEFKELMKLNTPEAKGVVKYLGDGDAIDEVVIFGDSREMGFALIRVLGDDMNPAHVMQLMQALQQSGFEGEALRGLSGFFKG